MDPRAYSYLSGLGATNDQIQQAMQRQAASASAAPQKGNFLTHALPTIGGIAGGLISLPTEALNAFLPGSGVAANLAVAGAGSAAGKGLENALEGNDLSSGMGSSFLEGATGQAGGRALGALGGLASKGLDSAGTGLLAKSEFGAVPKPIQIANKATSTVGNLADNGLAPNAYRTAIPKLLDILGGGTQKALEGANQVDISGLMPQASRVSAALETARPGSGNAFAKELTDSVDSIRSPGTPVVGGNVQTGTNLVNPNDLFKLQQQLEGDSYAKGVHPAVAGAKQSVARYIGDMLAKSGADDTMAAGVYSPSDIAALHEISPGIAQQAMGASTVGENRAIMAPLMKAKGLLNAADNQAESVGSGSMGSTLRKAGDVAGLAAAPFTGGLSAAIPALDATLGNSTGQRLLGTAMRKVAGNGLPGGQLATSALAQGAAHAPDFSSPQSALQGDQTPLDSSVLSSPTPAVPDATETAGLSGYTDTQLQQALAADLATGGQHASTIESLIQLNQSGVKADQPTAAQSKEGDFIRSAAGSVKVAANQLGQAGGADPLSSFIASIPLLGKYLEPNINAYNATRNDAGAALAAATVGGKPTASGTKSFTNSLPAASDSPDVARQKYANLLQQLAQRGPIYGVDPSEILN